MSLSNRINTWEQVKTTKSVPNNE